ncbi:hypothetical protein DPMN_083552 [Dreissena polymorpha]|uniref:Centromere protein Cenp-F N-terminal domain-containing protein n=1 Tax=Dreissena polymorpha TaxID=45954 RepID=A0A9D3YCN5_DREPO|nr:hypothetical protein DPMN_083552 [Dreissena polymorpha]
MSWAAEEWKVDLSHQARQKVEQLEGQLNRLKKEAEMKQFKIDSMEQVIQKEKKRVEDERSEMSALKRELQSITESCQDVEQRRQKLATDVLSKDSHINALNGQMAHLKKQLDMEVAKVNELEVVIQEKNQAVSVLEKQMKSVQKSESEATKSLTNLRTEYAILKQVNVDLAGVITDLRVEVSRLQEENCDLNAELMRETEVRNTVTCLKQQVSTLQDNLRQEESEKVLFNPLPLKYVF